MIPCSLPVFGEQKIPDADKNKPYESKNKKEEHESGKAGDDILQIHVSGPGDSLTDLDRKGQHYHHCENIDPGNREHMIFGEGKKQRVDQQQHSHPQKAHDCKMQLLICEKKGPRNR